MYNRHEAGHLVRQKLRIRSYVDAKLNFLEVKTKNNHGRTKKKRMTMEGFDALNPDHAIRFERQESVELDVVVLEVLDRLDGSSARRDATGASFVRLGAYAELVRIGNLQLQVERKRSFLRCRILHGKDAVGVRGEDLAAEFHAPA